MTDEIISLIVGAAILFFSVIALFTFKSYQCHTKAEMQGYECSWGPVQGCMVKVDGKWVDYDKWRIME